MSSNCFLPELDRKKTQEALEAEFEKYRIFKTVTFEEKEVNIIQLPRTVSRSDEAVTSDSTANVTCAEVPGGQKQHEAVW
ncbi:hypothetical protein P7H17_23985 [Paenibacillus larvae]|nr:hypothetical protein [Paenibacillus larvae]MDT2288493.1 hypothetical protein [Paenibacillus larvae]